MTVRVTLQVELDDAVHIAGIAESFARTSVGLAMDGFQCVVVVSPAVDEDEEVET